MRIFEAADDARTHDIIYAMAIAAPAAITQAKNANLPDVIGLTGADLKSDAIKTGKWIRANVAYKIDDFGSQNIQLPSALLKSGKGDCKSLSMLYLSIMEAAGYNGGFRYASYRENKPFTHVYVYFLDNKKNVHTFDACIKDLNEIQTYKKIKDMKVNYIAGVPMIIQDRSVRSKRQFKPTLKQLMSDDRYLSIKGIDEDGIGRKKLFGKDGALKNFGKNIKTKVGGFVKKGINAVKTVYLSPMRGPFLVLVDLNFAGMARKLEIIRSKNPAKLQEFWLKVGGDIDALNKAIDKGKGKKPILASKKTREAIKGANEVVYDLISGPDEYVGEPLLATITAAVSAASALLVAVGKLFKKEGIQSQPGEDEAIEENPEFDPNEKIGEDGGDFFAKDPATEEAAQYAASGGSKKPPVRSSSTLEASSSLLPGVETKINPMLIIGGVAALGAIYLLTKKK